ncbi:MAG: hypothetical protein H8E36_01970 [Rhodospirillaceae bacterium]|nr:hypothetical protein [Rhodospirillaceae bacterium]MBL6940903.1 hypothetical protein [Rhodospirillales bacterium]
MSGPQDEKGIPQRWKRAAKEGAYNQWKEFGIAENDDTILPPDMAIQFADENVDWCPHGVRLRGSIFVTIELCVIGDEVDQSEEYRRMVSALEDLSEYILAVGLYTYLLGCEHHVSKVYDAICGELDLRYSSFTAIDLVNRFGFAWNAADGVMIELNPANVWTTEAPANVWNDP